MKKTVTLTKEELTEACAKATVKLIEDLKDDKAALNKSLLYILVGGRFASELTDDRFGEETLPDEDRAEPVNHCHD